MSVIFFDESRPNKYSCLKRLLVPQTISGLTKKRYGEKDGSYVLAPELINLGTKVLSYGIGDDPNGVSFELEMSKRMRVDCYDASISEFPNEVGSNIRFYSEYLNAANFEDHVKNFVSDDPFGFNNVLKMDIEGCEYNWLNAKNFDITSKYFDQLAIEVHGLIEEAPNNWVFDPPTLEAKHDIKKKVEFFTRLNTRYILTHIHGNNHSPRHMDFPDSLELTYVSKKSIFERKVLKESRIYPVEGLDSPNYDGRPDYVLDWWI